MAALRSNRVVVYSVIAAAGALAACALLAIAWMLGWLPGAAPASGGAATAARQAAGNATDAALLPGEILVVPADPSQRREPLMPTYSRPTPPPPAPAAGAEAQAQAPTQSAPSRRMARPAPVDPRPAVTNPDALPTSPTEPLRAGRHDPYVGDPGRPGPQPPSFARSRERYAEGRYAQAPRSRIDEPCRECGRVQSITSSYPGLWDVRVRLDDGGGKIFRFRDVPPFRIGDRVRTDDERLMHD
jgi:hypothetical protein